MRPGPLAHVWDTITGVVGLVGCVVLLLRPDLRDLHILILFAGMAGVLPLNRVLDRLLR